jgi:hypothetical protein
MAADRKPFHKQCVKCFKCHKALNPATINEHQSQLFCKACYDGIFMPQEYSTGTYGGIVTPDDIRRREEEEKRRAEKAERAKRERRCPGCDMKVGHACKYGVRSPKFFWATCGTFPPPLPPAFWAHIQGRYWSAKRDDISLLAPDFMCRTWQYIRNFDTAEKQLSKAHA